MDQAARSMLYFGLVGLLMAGSIIAVFQTTPVIAKDGIVSVYFSSIPSDIQSDPSLPDNVAPAVGRPVIQILSLNVTIDSVSVHRSGAADESGWTEISRTPITLDIMRPTNVTMLVALGRVPEQNITLVRLHIASATAAVMDSQGRVDPKPVEVSGNELKIPLGSARVMGQLNTSIIADRPNILVQGNGVIRLTPVLHLNRITGPQ